MKCLRFTFAKGKQNEPKERAPVPLGPSDCPALLERAGRAKTLPLLAAGSDSLHALSSRSAMLGCGGNGSKRPPVKRVALILSQSGKKKGDGTSPIF